MFEAVTRRLRPRSVRSNGSRRRASRAGLRVSLLSALSGWIIALSAGAPLHSAPESGTQVVLPGGGEYSVLWRRLRDFAARENWDAVIEGLSRYVELATQPNVNEVIASGAGLAVGVRRVFAGLAAQLPPDVQSRFRERLDAVVTPMWESTIAQLSEPERVRMRHRLTRDYESASIVGLLLREELDEGFETGQWSRVNAASDLLLKRASTVPSERARTRVLRAHAAALGGYRDQLGIELAALRRLRDTPEYPSLSESLRTEVANTLASAKRLTQTATKRSQQRSQPALSAAIGTLNRAPEPPSSTFRLGETRWKSSLTHSPLRSLVASLSLDAAGDISIPYHAAASNEEIVFQHAERLVSFSTVTMRERWSLPLPRDEFAISSVRIPLLGPLGIYVANANALYSVDRLRGQPHWQVVFRFDPDENRLHAEFALDPTGDSDDDDASMPASACVVSPAAVFRDSIVVAVTVRHATDALTYAVAVDAEGNELWTTYLGSSGSSNYLGLGNTCSPPATVGGRVVVATNQGVLFAIDGVDGAIDWAYQYPSLDAASQVESIRTTNRWLVNPVLSAGNTLLVAPTDSSRLHAIDAESGGERWHIPRERGSALVGVAGDLCIVAGESIVGITHTGPRAGTIRWRRSVAAERAVSPLGRASLTRRGLLVPGRRQLLVLSPSDGTSLSNALWDFGGGGNLVLAGTALAVTTPESLIVYDQFDSARERALSTEDDQAKRYLRRAKFHLRQLDVTTGLGELRAWENSAPAPPLPNSEQDRLHVELAEIALRLSTHLAGAADARELLTFRKTLERSPERKVRAAIDLAAALDAAGESEKALSAYHEALEYDDGATEYSPVSFLPLSAASWVRERIRDLRARVAKKQDFADVESRAEEALRAARANSSVLAYDRVIQLWPFTRAAALAYRDLATAYRDRLSYEHAVTVLQNYLDEYGDHGDADSELSTDLLRARLDLVNLLAASGRRAAAKQLSLDLIANFGDRTVDGVQGMRRGENVRAYLEPRLRDPGLQLLTEDGDKRLRAPVRMSWRSPAELQAVSRRFLWPEGDWPEELEGCFLTQAAEFIECRSAATGLTKWRLSLKMIPGFQLVKSLFPARSARTGLRALRGRFVGSLLVLHDERNLFAIDARRGKERWHVPFGEAAERALRAAQPRVPPASRTPQAGVHFQRRGVRGQCKVERTKTLPLRPRGSRNVGRSDRLRAGCSLATGAVG